MSFILNVLKHLPAHFLIGLFTPDNGAAGKAGEDLLAHVGIGLHVRAAGVENDVDSALDMTGDDPGGFSGNADF